MNKNFDDFEEISLEKRYCDIDEDAILEQYGYSLEAVPIVAAGAIAAIVAAVVIVMKLIWDLISKKSESVEEAIDQVAKKEKDLPNLTSNMIAKLRGTDPRKFFEDDNKWTVRDEHFIDGDLKEGDLQQGVKQIDEHYTKFADIYAKIETDILAKFYKNIDELEKQLEAKKGLLTREKTKKEADTKATTSASIDASGAAFELTTAVKKIIDGSPDTFKFDHCEEVLKKTTGYKPHTWVNVKDPNTTQKSINDDIKTFYESFKNHMKELSKDGSVTIKMLEKANINAPEITSVLKADSIKNVKSKVKIDDDIKKLEDMGKKLDDRIKKLEPGSQKEAMRYIKDDLNSIKSTLALISTLMKVSMDIHMAYCGFYNRLVFCYVAVAAYQGSGIKEGTQVAVDNTKEATAAAEKEVADEKAAAAAAAAAKK